jgi:AbrB family looped-hinge helix DNA binding protein
MWDMANGTKTAGPSRGSRCRRAAPECGAPALPVYSVTMADRGRLVLPSEVRERLNIREGDPLALIVETDGTITLKTREVALDNLQGMYKHLAPAGRFASNDLIAERRRQARMEDREFRERSALHRRQAGR